MLEHLRIRMQTSIREGEQVAYSIPASSMTVSCLKSMLSPSAPLDAQVLVADRVSVDLRHGPWASFMFFKVVSANPSRQRRV